MRTAARAQPILARRASVAEEAELGFVDARGLRAFVHDVLARCARQSGLDHPASGDALRRCVGGQRDAPGGLIAPVKRRRGRWRRRRRCCTRCPGRKQREQHAGERSDHPDGSCRGHSSCQHSCRHMALWPAACLQQRALTAQSSTHRQQGRKRWARAQSGRPQLHKLPQRPRVSAALVLSCRGWPSHR